MAFLRYHIEVSLETAKKMVRNLGQPMLCRGSSKDLPNNFQALHRLNQFPVNFYVREGKTVCQVRMKPKARTCVVPTACAMAYSYNVHGAAPKRVSCCEN